MKFICSCWLLACCFVCYFITIKETSSLDVIPTSKPSTEAKHEILPPCQACRTLATSFKKNIEKTSRGKFEGGDALWEESRLKPYADSEVRFVEIQEKLCSDVEKSSEQCHHLAEEHEALLEEWWFKKKTESPDIFYFLCIDSLQVCCPPNHYGPECKPCPGGIVKPCSGYGQCKGAGTRKGSGLCSCDMGYTGNLCDICKTGYYNETGNNEWECVKCDKSCKRHCRESGPKGCEVCAEGYVYSLDLGCIDFDECLESGILPCKTGTFCVNYIGSYQCVECDRSCNGCMGDGPDMCHSCADGYVLHESVCIEDKLWKRSLHMEMARYATYLGLGIATSIIFRRNTYLASLVLLCVTIYVGVSEYTVGGWDRRQIFMSFKSFFLL